MSADPKAFATLQARAALLGVVLHARQLDEERWTYFAEVGSASVDFASLEEVSRWLNAFAQWASEVVH